MTGAARARAAQITALTLANIAADSLGDRIRPLIAAARARARRPAHGLTDAQITARLGLTHRNPPERPL